MRSRGIATALLSLAASGALGVTRPAGLGDIVAVQQWSDPTFSRVAIQISEPTEPELKQEPSYLVYLSGMPALLVEAGLVKHLDDARRLRDLEYRRAMTEVIAQAVGQFRNEAAPRVAELHR